MITVIALVLQVLISLISPTNSAVVVIPAQPFNDPYSVISDDEDGEWHEYEYLAYLEYCDEFDALFNSYDYKLSKNGRSMINGKFVKMGA
jgi:hypothetical protein